MQLTASAAQLYIATSQVALAHRVLSWDQYLLRLRFVKDTAEKHTLEARAAADILEAIESGSDDEWPTGQPQQQASSEAPKESEVSITDGRAPFEPPLLRLVVAGDTGLHQWDFHQYDDDFFPSIPHGHLRQDRMKKLDVYRGWIYRDDRQVGREPRWKIVALWNDEKFRTFASVAVQYYLITFPRYRWPIAHPQRLPRRRP
jgi:hypothetical protein